MDVTALRPTATATLPTTAATPAAVGPGLSIVPPTKSPEAESETPPRIQPSKPMSFSNGVLKRHAPPQIAYKECLKNHAASLGGHALDGCGEFMPSPTTNASDPTSLKCAACGCHRNFHRRDMDDNQPTSNAAVTHVIEYHPHHRHHPLPPPGSQHATPVGASARGVRSPGSQSQSPPPISSTYYPGSAPHMLLALSSGAGGGNGVPENNNTTPFSSNGPHHQHPQVHPHHQQHQPMMMVNSSSSQPPSRKRFRTKFSQDQKDKMYEFAEKVGWKMQKTNEELVNGFCNEIGVERGVFKVWMHNNKNTFGKRSATVSGSANCGGNPTDTASLNDTPIDDNEHEHHLQHQHGDLNGNGNNSNSSISINDQSHHHIQHHHHHQQYNGKSYESNAPTNGSSSSS